MKEKLNLFNDITIKSIITNMAFETAVFLG